MNWDIGIDTHTLKILCEQETTNENLPVQHRKFFSMFMHAYVCIQSRLTLCDPIGVICSWDFPGRSTGVDFHSLLQGIFPIQRLNLGLLHCSQMLYHLSHRRNPKHVQDRHIVIHEVNSFYTQPNITFPLIEHPDTHTQQ